MAAQYELLKELLNSGTKLSFGQDFFFKFYQAFLLKDRWMQYISGVGTTLLVTALALALGVESLDGLTRRIDTLLHEVTTPKATLWEKLRMLPLLGEMARWMPRSRRGRGPCQEVVLRGGAARLSLLPVLKCWPEDGGRFVTLPMVHTLDPDIVSRGAVNFSTAI